MFSRLRGVPPKVQRVTVRGLAVTTAMRPRATPEIPTIAETVPGYEVSAWWGLFVPVKTAADILVKIHADAVAALTHASVKQRYAAIGAPVTVSTPSELANLVALETEKWGPIIKEA